MSWEGGYVEYAHRSVWSAHHDGRGRTGSLARVLAMIRYREQ